ncbi:MAG: deoxycytidine triphosphate deaminase [Metallosphaera yellowstonensis]|jgi:deoxycytidine triphosphate deaminase|uniref:Deoxycytidine deaminase n=1 Tax=Metallosphaera yellowstonensis MK1 TaxID=671065 RepID=H2C7H0_9CREN|nr:deoxycytidine triphosphate deaminase [Metallosphaera yellowstonensis]EHP68096.1 deoxycytidine deaminase [Metallosphaera yellowstonensis MK1]
MILTYQQIRNSLGSMILNFSEESVRENGYDLRVCGDKYWRILGGASLPEKKSEVEEFPFEEYADLEPGNTYLLESCEEVNMPNDVMGIMTLRSTMARNGFLAPPTVIDAGYKGKIIIALSTLRGGRIRRGFRVVHLIFAKLQEPTLKVYEGSYQGGKLI